ncbi:MAG: peptidylprolyl isomerase [Nitrosopumilus sp.]|nr:peptidylprolyl isomerase [Nitrosopumilus sp.]
MQQTHIENPLVVLDTNLGKITIEFFYDDAPNHVENFIKLTQSGFYDGVIFHRIIPGFMIQGGDPNTIDGDPSSWGTGGPSTNVDAEFNTIKHNRGIVSMARSADPNSAGSQFFIVHADSNFLDEQYTVFGRIVTEESFETLDKIASVETGSKDNPLEPEQVKITRAIVVDPSEISDLLELGEPERTESIITPSTGNQKYESTEHEIGFSVPEGWLLQTPDKTEANAPDVVAVGPKTGIMNPVISLTVQETNQRTLDELILEKIELINPAVDEGSLKIISQEKMIVNGYDAYVINAQADFTANGESFDVQFKEVMIYDTEKFYSLAYSNELNNFESQLPRFEETIDSFEILSNDTTNNETKNQTSTEEGGGCLIATATFGSELAPQVQQLREIRDNTILSTESGIAFMSGFNQFYYSFSPTIADLERENPVFKEFVKISITPMLSTLSILNYADINSETEMLSFGIGIILMNVGMYFAAPAIIIYKIRK